MDENKTETETKDASTVKLVDQSTLNLKGYLLKLKCKDQIMSKDGSSIVESFSAIKAIARLAYFVGGVLVNGMYIKKDMVK